MNNNIESERKKAGLKQQELADILGVNVNTVSSWENEKVAPNGKALAKMALVFHCTTDYLLALTEERT